MAAIRKRKKKQRGGWPAGSPAGRSVGSLARRPAASNGGLCCSVVVVVVVVGVLVAVVN